MKVELLHHHKHKHHKANEGIPDKREETRRRWGRL
jgi:hypothetical protein